MAFNQMQKNELLLGRGIGAPLSLPALKLSMSRDTAFKFTVCIDDQIYELVLNERGDVLVVFDPKDKRVLDFIPGNVYLTPESAERMNEIRMKTELASARSATEPISNYIGDFVDATYSRGPLYDPVIRSLIDDKPKVDRYVYLIEYANLSGLELNQPDLDFVQRVKEIVKRLQELGVNIDYYTNVEDSDLGYPNEIIYFDSYGYIERILSELFRKAFDTVMSKERFNRFLTRNKRRKVIILSYSQTGFVNTLATTVLNEMVLTDETQVFM